MNTLNNMIEEIDQQVLNFFKSGGKLVTEENIQGIMGSIDPEYFIKHSVTVNLTETLSITYNIKVFMTELLNEHDAMMTSYGLFLSRADFYKFQQVKNNG